MFDGNNCDITLNDKQIAVADKVNGLYKLRKTDQVNACLEGKEKYCIHQWHRFGHRNPEEIKFMNKNKLVNGMSIQ